MNKFEKFDDLDIPNSLADALHHMKFVNPTPIQEQAIPPALEGKDILGTAQTGTGKTAAFGVPILARLYHEPKKQALILAPTRELAAQIFEVMKNMAKEMRMYGVLVVGGESFHRQADEIKRGVDFIVATPGRLTDHLQERTVTLDRVGYLALDEVDRMLDMGFAPQIKRLMEYIPKERQTLLFSATLPREITNLAHSLLKEPVRCEVGSTLQIAPKIEESTVKTSEEGKMGVLLRELETREGRLIIFTRTKSRCDRVARNLEKAGHKVVRLHGDRSQGQRKEALERFRTGKCRILVATDLAGRGIDVTDIEHVINYDIPQSREDYIHRIGRTGRIGKTGSALNFLVPTDIDGERVLLGEKAPSRVVFRSSRRGRAFGARR